VNFKIVISLVAGLGIIITELTAQSGFDLDYQPIKERKIDKEKLKSLISLEFQDEFIAGSNAKKDMMSVQEMNLDNIHYKIDSSIFISDDMVEPYFQKIFNEILQANPELKGLNPRLFVSRETIPNAYAMGNGIMVFNLSLLQYLENESQIAFIICHEFSHNYLRHVFENIERKAALLKSKATKEEYNKAKRSYSKAQAFILNLRLSDSRHGQAAEFQADSLGLQFFSKTKYNVSAAITGLNCLDIMREDPYPDSLDLRTIFTFSEYPFKDSWVKEPQSFIFEEPDSVKLAWRQALSSHPELVLRMSSLEQMIQERGYAGGSLFIQDSQKFFYLKELAHFEQILSEEKFNNLDIAIYLTLKQMRKHPNNAFLHRQLHKYFERLVAAYENHELMRYILPSSSFHEKDFKILSRLLNNLRFSEMKRLTTEIEKKYQLN